MLSETFIRAVRESYDPAKLGERPAEPDDFDNFIYSLVKRLVGDAVRELADGDWPEPAQRDFYEEEFQNPNTTIITYKGKPVGVYCISEETEIVKLTEMYLEPVMQGRHLGRKIIDMALQQAHRAQKPLELDVLRTNRSAIAIYEHVGFEKVGTFDGEPDDEKWSWLKLDIMRHRDTIPYAPDSKPEPNGL